MSVEQADYGKFLQWFEGLVGDIIPNHAGTFSVGGDEDQKRLRITINFQEDEAIGLLCGYVKTNLRGLLHMARAQQIYPHDRFILLELVKSDGTKQSFWNKNCAKIRKGEEGDRNEKRQRALHRSFLVGRPEED